MPTNDFTPPISKERLEALWLEYTAIEISKKTGLTVNKVYFYARRYGLPSRPRQNLDHSPTPSEIAERAAAIRSQWSDEEAERRWCGPKTQEWRMPEWSFA